QGHQRVDMPAVHWVSQPRHGNRHEKMLAERLDAYVVRLRELASRIRALGAKPIYVIEPEGAYRRAGGEIVGQADLLDVAGVDYNGVDIFIAMSLLSERTRRVCTELGIPFFDVGADVD